MANVKINESLESNANFTKEVKENILELVEIFERNFPEINLDNLAQRLKTLIIKRESKYLVKVPCEYNSFKNELLVNKGKFEGCEAKHWMMHCLLQIITAKENYCGFDNADNTLIALNEGYTEILTNYLVGDVESNFYTDEIIIVNLISKVIGNDILFNAYFNNDTESVLRAMIEAEVK